MRSSLPPQRVHSLDALRGLAIFGMILSGLVPAGLPDWMYHDQHWIDGQLVVQAGLTWVDLVFPLFLFSMGASIPLALSRRLDRGVSVWQVGGHVVYRGLILAALAIFLGNSNAWAMMDRPTTEVWLKVIVGFWCIVLGLMRYPEELRKRPWLPYVLRTLAVIGAVWLMAAVTMKDSTGFDKSRNNIIILLLANAYFFAALLWLLSRDKILLRLAFIAFFIAVRLNTTSEGWLVAFEKKYLSFAPWLFTLFYAYYAVVTLLGTIVGDLLVRWQKQPPDEIKKGLGMQSASLFIILLGLLGLVVGGHCFLQTRLVGQGFAWSLFICLLILFLFKDANTPMARHLRVNFYWCACLLLIGYVIEPFEGGIHKDCPTTLSYFIITVGMSIALLIFLFMVMDGLKCRKWALPITVIGSNPLLAYVMGSWFVYPVLHLTGSMAIIEQLTTGIGLGLVRAFFLTFLVTFVVYIFTRFKIYVRI